MQASSRTRDHVADFLAAVDPAGSFMRAAAKVASIVREDPQGPEIFGAVRTWIQGPLVDAEHRELHRRVYRRKDASVLGESPETTTLLSVGYTIVVEALQGASLRGESIETAKEVFRRIPQRLQELEADFVGELLVETEIRAGRDTSFAARLDRSVEELRSLVPEFREFKEQLPPLREESSALPESDVRLGRLGRLEPDTFDVLMAMLAVAACFVLSIVVASKEEPRTALAAGAR